jgi:hypothetical protein
MEKSFELVRNPQTPGGILGYAMHGPTGNATYRRKPVILQVTATFNCRDPNSPARILKKGNRPMEFRISFAEARNSPARPAIQAGWRREPNASILGG